VKPETPKPEHISVRLRPEIIARLDAIIPALSMPWHTATRVTVLRAALLKGLPLLEAEHAPKPRPGKRGGAR
jgi:hypothetical protein